MTVGAIAGRAPPHDPPRWPAQRRGLLVEDNEADADYVADLLREDPTALIELIHVARLGDAQARLDSNHLDFVLLDLRLPDAEGVRCVQTVRRWAANVPIVVLTGVEDAELALACIAAGAQDYLPKQDLRLENLRRAIDYAQIRVQEREQRQRAAAAQAHLAAIVDASTDAILGLSIDDRITSWNGGAEAAFGYSAEEVVTRRVVDVLRGWDPGAHPADAPPMHGEIELARRDGELRTFSLVQCPLRGPGGETIGHAAILRDITEMRRRDDALLRSNAELQARDRQMRALTARLNAVREEERTRMSREVHDELGQLLTGLKLDLRWIGRRLPVEFEPTIGPRLNEAVELVDRTIRTVQRLAVELRPSALDALGLSAALRDEARRFERRTGLVVDVQLAEDCRPDAAGATALFRIFQELCTNIARHASATSVSISLSQDGDVCSLSVGDDGVGLRAAAPGPTTLGLLGMRERAEALGGTVRFESPPGGGTLVTVTIPATACAPS